MSIRLRRRVRQVEKVGRQRRRVEKIRAVHHRQVEAAHRRVELVHRQVEGRLAGAGRAVAEVPVGRRCRTMRSFVEAGHVGPIGSRLEAALPLTRRAK